MRLLRIDIETFSKCDLKKCGAYKYAEDESTEMLSAVYRFDEGPLTLWVPYKVLPAKTWGLLRAGVKELAEKGITVAVVVQEQVPDEVRLHITAGGDVAAFNAPFERTQLNGAAGKKLDFPHLTIEQMICTAVKARAAGLPDDLGSACSALGTYPKSEAGHIVMLQLSKPRKPSKDNPEPRHTIDRFPEKFAQLYLYNIDDVLAETDLDIHLPSVSDNEWQNWFMDQEMNDRGVYIDIPAVEDFMDLIERRKTELEARCTQVTGFKATQREQIANWVRANGYPRLTDMQADTVAHILEGDECPDNCKEILRIYMTYGMKAVAKFKTMLMAVCKDHRLHGMFMFLGAGTTGRWSSKIVQLQNLLRPVIDDCDVAIAAAEERDLNWIKDLWPAEEPMKVFGSCIRGMLRAKPDARLFAIDYSGIESRFGAWVFGEHWKLKVFRDYDTILGYDGKKPIRAGFDNYVTTYAELFGIRPQDVNKDQRQQAKPIDLALLYEGGVASFVTMAATYGVDLQVLADSVWDRLDPEALDSAEWMWEHFGKASGLPKKIYLACDAIKWMWRRKHPHVVQGWKDLKAAAIDATLNPGDVYGIPNKKVLFKVVDRWLVMLLPSGRKIRYFEPRVEGVDRKQQLTYMGVDTDTRRWMRTSIYGGTQANHVCQGGSSDLLRYGMRQLRKESYPLVMTVHDEAVMEAFEDFHDFETARKIYLRKEEWAKDFPLAAEGFEAIRFRK